MEGTYGCTKTSPQRAANASCWSGVSIWSRNASTWCSRNAVWSCSKVSSSTPATSTPVTIAPHAPAWRATCIGVVVLATRGTVYARPVALARGGGTVVDRLRGKVALVTGAASGQGEAEARRFVAEGARVAVADIAEERGRAVASELGDVGCFVALDVTDPAQWDGAVASVVGVWERIDVLVNNAGIGLPPVPFVDAPLADHYRVIDVNLHGVYLGMRAVVPAMTAGGSIVNISSIDGMVGVAGMTSYVASKFAVRGMTRSAALELGPRGIRVNSIHPGVIETPLV